VGIGRFLVPDIDEEWRLAVLITGGISPWSPASCTPELLSTSIPHIYHNELYHPSNELHRVWARTNPNMDAQITKTNPKLLSVWNSNVLRD
jgi:hypothetical protein